MSKSYASNQSDVSIEIQEQEATLLSRLHQDDPHQSLAGYFLLQGKACACAGSTLALIAEVL
jgi:hypothetical protein